MNSKPVRAPRRLGLDALRGVAVLLMMEQHLGIWLWEGPRAGETLRDYPALVMINALGGGAAPLFLTLAGIGSVLLVQRHAHPDSSLMRRGAVLLGFGLLLNLATPSWFTWRSWFVLHTIGLALFVAPALRRLSNTGLYLLCGLIFAVTVAGQTYLDTPVPLWNARMGGWVAGADPGELTLLSGGWWRLMSFEGHFPVFPWLGFYVLGLAGGRLVQRGELKRLWGLGLVLLLFGGLGSLVGMSSAIVGDDGWVRRALHVNVPFYPASPTFVLALAGAVLLAVVGSERLEARLKISSRGALVVLGRASLTLLLVHVVVGREGSKLLDIWRTYSSAQTLLVLAGVLVVSGLAARQWARGDYRYGAEWLLRKLGS